MNILLGVSGGIAAYKACDLISSAVKKGHVIRCIMTDNAKNFIGPSSLEGLCGTPVMTGSFEHAMMHIEWAKWADIACIAPLTANTMAKIACGIADDALTTTFLAIPEGTPVVLCPAMNTEMWNHPATQRNRSWINNLGRYSWVEPITKRLACGDHGIGGLADTSDIISALETAQLDRQ